MHFVPAGRNAFGQRKQTASFWADEWFSRGERWPAVRGVWFIHFYVRWEAAAGKPPLVLATDAVCCVGEASCWRFGAFLKCPARTRRSCSNTIFCGSLFLLPVFRGPIFSLCHVCAGTGEKGIEQNVLQAAAHPVAALSILVELFLVDSFLRISSYSFRCCRLHS